MEFQLLQTSERSNEPVAFLRTCISWLALFFTTSVPPSPFSSSPEWTCWASHGYALPARGRSRWRRASGCGHAHRTRGSQSYRCEECPLRVFSTKAPPGWHRRRHLFLGHSLHLRSVRDGTAIQGDVCYAAFSVASDCVRDRSSRPAADTLSFRNARNRLRDRRCCFETVQGLRQAF